MYGVSQRQRVLVVLAAVAVIVAALFVFRPGERASAGVDLDDPTAWIEHGLDGELLQINGVTGEVTARVAVAEAGDSIQAVAHGTGAAVLNRTANTVSFVGATQLEVTETIAVDLSEGASDRSLHMFGGTTDDDDVVVVDEDQLLSVDRLTERITPISFSEPTQSVVQDPSGVVLALRDDVGGIQQLGANGLELLTPLVDPVAGDTNERVIVRAGGSIWLVDPARLAVVEVEPDGELGRPVCVMSSANGAVVGGSSAGESPLIVGYNPARGLVNIVEPATGTCSEFELELTGDDFGPPVVNDGFVYLPNWGEGRIEIIDLAAERQLLSLPFGTAGSGFDLDVRGSSVWANEPQGPFAAVVNESGLRPVSKLAAIVAGAVEVNEDGDGGSLVGADIDGPGLRILGESGDEVIAAAADSVQVEGEGPGTGPASTEPALDSFADTPDVVPSAIGVAIDQPGGADTDLSADLIANFAVSSATAKVDEIVRFTDFSSGSPSTWTWDFGDGTGAQEPDVEKSWSDEGVYLVELRIRNDRGQESFLTTEITVVPRTVLIAPTADFVFDKNTIEVGETIALESRTIGEADILEWDLGDGTVVRGPTVEHQYGAAGVYEVTLVASNPAGSSSVSTEITVVTGVEPPRAAIAALPAGVVDGQFVTLRSASLNDPTTLRWDLGDGTRASGTSVRHAWSTPGTYRIRLTVENSAGSDSTFVDIAVAKRTDPPVSQFTQSATEVVVGQAVRFSDLSLNEPTRWAWNFGDDTTASGPTATKTWDRPGRYRVTLRVTNDGGTNRSGVTITVVEPVDPPTASFDASATVVAPGESISFSDTSANNPTAWNWAFGDGAVSRNQSTSHVYESEGTYVARLTVSNEGGTSTAERTIVVKPRPSANFRWAADGRSVKFTDTSWDDPESYSWNFGDGNTSTDRSPTHRFAAAGEYEVTLRVSNGAGTSAPKTQTVRVGEPPVADFDCSVDGRELRCDGRASTNAASFRWRSGDAILITTPGQATSSFFFESSGRYDITLEVTSASGETDTLTQRSPRVSRLRAPRVTDVRVASQDLGTIRLEAIFDRNPTSWEWSVEGAEIVEGANSSTPVFRVPVNGTYRGQVRASNAVGDDVDTFTFTANSLVTEASFDWDLRDAGVVAFTNTSTARGNADYTWVFPGAEVVINDDPMAPVVQYPVDGGSYRVVLTVTDANGTDRVARTIDVPPA